MSTNDSEKFLEYWAGMHFESRQIAWDGSYVRAFRQLHSRSKRTPIWMCWVRGDRYFTKHGLDGGKMQETSKKGKLKNPGKANELTPEMDAMAEARRLCRKKWDYEGYDEHVGDTNVDNRGQQSIPHMLASLPSSFCLYKPANNILECKGLMKKVAAGKVIYTLKRNGLAHWVVKDHTGAISIYSRRNRISHKDEGPKEQTDGTMDYSTIIPWSTRYPYLVQAFQGLDIPNNTMFAVEFCHPEGDEKSHFAHVQSVSKSLTPQAIERQEAAGWLVGYIWDIAFLGGEDLVRNKPPAYRYRILANLISQAPEWVGQWLRPIQHTAFSNGLDAVLEYAKDNQLEGYVVVDPEGIYEDKGWNLRGKPDRPTAFCAKAKPWFEDDFIVKWDPASKVGIYGKGRHEAGKKVTLPSGEEVIHGGVGSVGLHQYNAAGELVYISDCSSGMDYEFQAKLRKDSFPMVWEVKYTERSYVSEGDKTNALTFAKLFRVRTDKKTKECINDKL